MSFLLILFIIAIWGFFIAIIYHAFHRDKYEGLNVPDESYETAEQYSISARVSKSFHEKVDAYCFEKRITVSDLVRRAVAEYMNRN